MDLDLLKQLLHIEPTDKSQDDILNYNIRKSEKAIKKYSRIDDLILKNYTDEVVDLAFYYYKNQKFIGVKNINQGKESKTYEVTDIPAYIKSRLPLPSIKMW